MPFLYFFPRYLTSMFDLKLTLNAACLLLDEVVSWQIVLAPAHLLVVLLHCLIFVHILHVFADHALF